MTRTSLSRYPCPVARAVDVIGDPWSLLVLRDAIAGVRRFSVEEVAVLTLDHIFS